MSKVRANPKTSVIKFSPRDVVAKDFVIAETVPVSAVSPIVFPGVNPPVGAGVITTGPSPCVTVDTCATTFQGPTNLATNSKARSPAEHVSTAECGTAVFSGNIPMLLRRARPPPWIGSKSYPQPRGSCGSISKGPVGWGSLVISTVEFFPMQSPDTLENRSTPYFSGQMKKGVG